MAASETAAAPDTLGSRSVLLLTFTRSYQGPPAGASAARPALKRGISRASQNEATAPASNQRDLGQNCGIPRIGTRLALGWGMATRRVHPAAIAAASDGSVLINVIGLLPASMQQRLGAELGEPVFVGIALSRRDAGQVMARLDGAAAEASAHLLGGRPGKSAKSAKSRARRRR